MSDLESFALDPANRAAAAAARAVADGSGVPYGPLVVVGAPGSGKTELLAAIAERIRSVHPRATVQSLDPDALVERQRRAQLAGRGDESRAELIASDLLLLDDLERLSRYRDYQGLVADLLDARRAAGREVVVALSQAPARLAGLDARLLRRLGEGTTVQLTLPGPEARLAILRARLERLPGRLPDEVLRAIAATEFPSMRDYTGALSRLIAFQEASAVPLSSADALLLIGATVSREVGKSGSREVPSPPVIPASQLPVTSSDEFADFLSDVTAGVSEQVDRWRRRIGEAVLRWAAEGLRTARLEALLEQEAATDPEPVLAAYERDARDIQAIAREAAALAPDLAGAEVFRDPDQIAAARELVAQARSRATPLSAPLAHYRWEDLAEGPASRLVMLAGRDIIAEPGRRYSPLLLVGGPGSGKSHFLHALGNALSARGIGPIACLGGPAFAAEVRGLADAESLASWRRRYRWVGAFLLDDLQLLAEERRAQEELAQLVAELQEGQRQMVFASTRPLEELSGLVPGLAERLRGGLQVELPAPDREVRLAVVKRLLAATPAAQDAALADYLGGRPAESVRDVLGTVQRVLNAALSQQVAPSPALAREVLEVMALSAPRGAPRAAAGRSSGILSPGLGMVKSREKSVDQWPAITDRLIAELR
ncbi:MAG TPA: DnaA/Hda family protein [Gemmatimonadales bacterium]|jgi:chromosomal replication initiation ATPase DnaA|nr:DnaA/Hda family protein [Gemmatimonadales bacterium]